MDLSSIKYGFLFLLVFLTGIDWISMLIIYKIEYVCSTVWQKMYVQIT